MNRWHSFLDTPVGRLRLVATDAALCGVYFPDHRHVPAPATLGEPRTTPLLDEAARQLAEYFAGARTRFELPVETTAGTPFQRAVWRALADIPFAARRSYADLARAVGDPRACRAVGAANGRNPLSIIVPCHRVVGSDGSLTGYAGGDRTKRWLLEHEAAVARRA